MHKIKKQPSLKLNAENLELVKQLLEEKIDFHKENIFYLKQDKIVINIIITIRIFVKMADLILTNFFMIIKSYIF